MSSFSKGRAAGVVLVVTTIEDIGLIVWLGLFRAAVGVMALGIAGGTLFVFLIVEHSIMQRAENPDFTGRIFARIFGFTLLEVINWGVWLTLLSNTSGPLLSRSSLIASAYFFVGFYIEHQITENVISNQPYLRFRNVNRVITAGVILETLSEGVGARLWVFYGPIGIVALVIGSLVEHSIQYVVGRQPVESQIVNLQSAQPSRVQRSLSHDHFLRSLIPAARITSLATLGVISRFSFSVLKCRVVSEQYAIRAFARITLLRSSSSLTRSFGSH